jgi:hypothetical protein
MCTLVEGLIKADGGTQQTGDNRQQTVDSKQQIVDSRHQTADSMQVALDSRPQTVDNILLRTLVARLMEADGGTLDLKAIVKTGVRIFQGYTVRRDNRQQTVDRRQIDDRRQTADSRHESEKIRQQTADTDII